ncbi:MAG TPA: hydantoinase B/oxoprolinase family protein [Methylomirabilota bacterium]|jgi:N-methylhydantoinase B|nr:hydantoinase B/oxoprolinase family protein [Methylomirabilota bacterium]
MTTVDPITLEILTEVLISIVREMRATVFRTARSVAIYEAKDFSCGLFDHTSEVIAQSEDIGAHVVPLPWSVRSAMAEFAGDLAPGDVILLNDPYRGGTHLNDVTLIYPVFEDGRLILFPAVREHWADVGGMVPGSLSGEATEIYQEGLRIPPIKIVERGTVNRAAMALILTNMRVPDEREGDFHAGLAACKTAERRIRESVARYGLETLLGAIRQNLDRSEARMRARIAALPDGTYHYEDYLETFPGGRLEPLLLPLRLTIDGDGLLADFTGASPQVPVPVNSTLAVSAASVFIALKSILDPAAPLNQGSFRPIRVIAPEGTIVNVTPPAPAGSHGEIRKRVIAVTVGALAQVVPELVAGDLFRTSFHNLVGGVHPRTGKQYVHYEWASGGNGAFAEADGPSAMASIDWGDLNTVQPTEVLETRFPLLLEWSSLARDSGGVGRRRGGLSMRRGLRLLGPDATYSVLADGAVLPAFGIGGGGSGIPVGSHVVRDGRDVTFASPGKVAGFHLVKDDVLVLQSAGGGGYGDPLERPIEQVLDDLRDGYISAERCRERYGVVVRDDGEVDTAATEALRRQLAAQRVWLRVTPTDDALYERGAVSKRRVCRLSPADAARPGFAGGAIVELVAPRAAPLRAWVVLDDAVEPGSVPLDPRGRQMLGVAAGEPLHVRPLRD